MSVWGKIAGAAAGLAIGGPIGALLGGVAGHFAIDREDHDTPAESQVAFTVGVIALGAKMAKADGVVTVDEVNAFKEVFKVPEGEMKNVARVFNLAKQDVSGFEAYAEQLAAMFKNDEKLLEDVLEGLFHIAKADDTVHPREEEFLRQVAKRFGLSDSHFDYIKARHVVAAKRNPYEVLGIDPSVGNDQLKAHYRKLVADNHPDKLLARGVPPEFITIATEKLAAINESYDAIAKERRI
ncbi:TerB family tellurite resistance protein [Methyloligella sp. 2.7D]|uniref:TerB family tellurite resistance protein n=1 Tax=unclassified Methyloligella TaxID=2625955 RepID=UPI00157CD5B7|nr:TerB family tellurite resistance protein [Methyloligella sp. GL2]QKP78004.1 TerB family tellurite resistance protein [Methyloligella sp. GL2]